MYSKPTGPPPTSQTSTVHQNTVHRLIPKVRGEKGLKDRAKVRGKSELKDRARARLTTHLQPLVVWLPHDAWDSTCLTPSWTVLWHTYLKSRTGGKRSDEAAAQLCQNLSKYLLS